MNIQPGVIIEKRDSDYVSGSSPILHEIRNSTKDWTRFIRPGERQSNLTGFDGFECVTQSFCNNLETQVEQWITEKMVSESWIQKVKDLGFFDTGRFQVSRRFTAKMSGTTKSGNSYQGVVGSLRKDGFVAESRYPSTKEGHTWESYYAEIPADIKELGKKSLELISILSEEIQSKNIGTQLAHSPIVVFTPVSQTWFTDDIVKPDGQTAAAHATQVFAKPGNYKNEDSYPRFIKELRRDYPIPHAFKMVCSPIDRGTTPPPPFLFLRDLVYGETSEDVRQLQIRLNVPQTRTYDSTTRAAVFAYQLTHISTSPSTLSEVMSLWGRRVGPKTRDNLNKKLVYGYF